MADQYIYDMTDTWNNGATTYDAIKMNVTDSASAAGSRLLALQVGAVDKFVVSKAGAIVAAAGATFAGALIATTLALTSTLAAVDSFTLTSADAGAAAGPTITMDRNSASPAASDAIGTVKWNGQDSGGNAHTYIQIDGTITDPTNGSEDATLNIRTSIAGTLSVVASVTATGWNSMNIGATTAGTGRFTTATATTAVTFNDGTITGSMKNGGGYLAVGAVSNHPGALIVNDTPVASFTSTGLNSAPIGVTTPASGAFTTLSATSTATLVAANLTGDITISKVSPRIIFTSTGTGSDSTISENTAGITYAADANNESAGSFHIWTVDGTQSMALNTTTLALSSNVGISFAGTGAATTRTNLGLVIGTNVQAWDADLDTWATKTAPSGVVVGTTDTQTLTNKTLTGAALNGTLGATTPSTAAVSNLTSSGFIRFDNGTVVYQAAAQSAGVVYRGTTTAHNVVDQINSVDVGTWTSTGLNSAAIGATTRSTGAFTTLAANSTVTFTSGGSMTGTWSSLGTVTAVTITTATITTANFGTFSATGASTGKQITNGTLDSSTTATGAPPGTHQRFYNDNGLVGSITTTFNQTNYNTASDYRLPWKKGRTAIVDSGAFIDALKPYYFPKAGKSGFVAHEFAQVSPQSVSGEKDAVDENGDPILQQMQSSTDDVMANIIAELQSLRARVALMDAA